MASVLMLVLVFVVHIFVVIGEDQNSGYDRVRLDFVVLFTLVRLLFVGLGF